MVVPRFAVGLLEVVANRADKFSDLARDCVLHRKDIRRIFFAVISFFNLTVRYIKKLCGDLDFPARQLIIRRENVINLLLLPGGNRVLPDVRIFASRAQRSDDESFHRTEFENQGIGNPDFVNLVAVRRVDGFERQDGD